MPQTASNISTFVTIDAVTCCVCGMAFGIASDFLLRLLNERRGQGFYCPAGHSQMYTGKSEADRLREELAQKERELVNERERVSAARRVADSASRRASAMKGQVTRVRNRVANGVCPCCRRSFVALARHMTTQHPGYSRQDIG